MTQRYDLYIRKDTRVINFWEYVDTFDYWLDAAQEAERCLEDGYKAIIENAAGNEIWRGEP